ncbi:ATP-binding protein [Leptospira interrogans]|uniref:ATP-binding protein n=1 Tax=Leptospira interrogans TaxID=173 RepID=UPI0002BF2F11|nr:ATP-binding protein [Leptospira interrogans]EMN54629.1 AAA domain protein [Leptospira interrogans serovar Autumnalis str. LP101]
MNFVDTENTNKVIRAIRQAVSSQSWECIVGQTGTGKTVVYEYMLNFWKSYPNRFHVIEMGRCFESFEYNINQVMKVMISELSPDSVIPGNAHAKQLILRDILSNAYDRKRKIVLMFDESQALTARLLRDLKKLHEISSPTKKNLFSIIMFGKAEGEWLRSIMKTQEIGWRLHKTFLDPLKDYEVLSIAEKAFSIKFESGQNGQKTRQIFIQNTFPTPLGVENQIKKIAKSTPGWDRILTYDVAKTKFPQSIGDILKRLKITQREVAKRVRNTSGKEFSKSAISTYLNGDQHEIQKSRLSSDGHKLTMDAALDLIRDHSTSASEIHSAENLIRTANE